MMLENCVVPGRGAGWDLARREGLCGLPARPGRVPKAAEERP